MLEEPTSANVLDISKLFNCLIDPYYSYLINVMNTNKDIVVDVSAVYMTTTDFVIYYGEKPVDANNLVQQFKYVEYKNGEYKKLEL